MKNKSRAIIGILMLSMALTACNSTQPSAAVKPTNTVVTEQPTATPTEAPTATPTEEPTSTPTAAVAPQSSDTLSSNYADFDDMSILINGFKYTFNKSTLQDMIDNQVPFVDISNANNNIRPNYESETFEIQLDDDHLAYVTFSNFTDENKSINECPLSSLTFDVVENDVLKLSCPFDLTETQLLANAGEPKDIEYQQEDINTVQDTAGDPTQEENVINYATYKYTQLSEKYLGDHGYYFLFKDGVLYNYTVTYR